MEYKRWRPPYAKIVPLSALARETPSEIQRVAKLVRALAGATNVSATGGEQHDTSVTTERVPNPQPDHFLQLCTIYRVPEHIRSCNTDAYNPKVVSIGPYHQDGRETQSTDHEIKRGCTRLLITRHLRQHPDITDTSLIERCLTEMKALVPQAWSCYSDKIYKGNYSEYQYAEKMFFDGCTILHMLLKQAESNTQGEVDYGGDHLVLGGNLWIWSLLVYDLLLLENQMPFFVIRRLYELLRTPDDAGVSLVDLALKLFCRLYPRCSPNHPPILEEKVHHLLHLFYLSLLPGWAQERGDSVSPPPPEPEWIPCVSELRENGVKFAKKTDEAGGFLDVTFRNGKLHIPPLHLCDDSEPLFRNLLAFEQCYPDTGTHITLYATFMDLLLSSPADARILQRKGILVNHMTANREGSNFFGRLCEQLHYASDANYLRSVFVEVNRYYQRRRHKWKARLLREYCSNPWIIASVIAASVLLLVTVAQTFYAIYPYYHHRN